jgi:membrane protease YdiL (CAAX protease family)
VTRTPSRPVQAILLLLLWIAVTTLTGVPAAPGETVTSVMTGGLARQIALAAGLLVVAAWLLRWRGLGLGPVRPGTLRLLWLPCLYLLLYAAVIAATGLPPAGVATILLVNVLLASFSEEMMFRGFLYSGLRDRMSIWPAALTASILFGAVHVANVFLTGQIWAAVLQSLAACLSGLLFLALRLRMGSIWPAILLHAAWNFGLILLGRDAAPLPPPGTGGEGAAIPALAQAGAILFVLPLGLYGLWLLRAVARDGDGLGPGDLPPLPLDAPAPHRT